MSHNGRVTAARRAAKANKFNNVRKIVCEQIGIPYQPMAAPSNLEELRATEWGGLSVDPATANRTRLYGRKSFEILNESAGA